MPASRLKSVRLLAQKELVDLLRDRRTIITALVIPLVSFPILFGVVGFFANPVSNHSQVAIVNLDSGGALSSNLTASLLDSPGIHVRLLPSAATSNLTGAVQKGDYDVGVVVPFYFSSSIA